MTESPELRAESADLRVLTLVTGRELRLRACPPDGFRSRMGEAHERSELALDGFRETSIIVRRWFGEPLLPGPRRCHHRSRLGGRLRLCHGARRPGGRGSRRGTGRCCRMHQVQTSRCSQETTSRDAISATRVRYEPSSSGVSIALPVPDRPCRKKAVSSRKSPGGPGVRRSARERMP